MKTHDGAAKEAGVTLLNELGVDPGIDHMTAMKVIHPVQADGGEITTFQSYCGGLPAPEANDNPFGYKFSWSPRGVILAGLNDARYRRDGREVRVPGAELFDHQWQVPVEVEGKVISFIGYPNRDSMPYTEYYGIDAEDTMFRGTLRFPHWCAAIKQMARLGWLGTAEPDDLEGKTFADHGIFFIFTLFKSYDVVGRVIFKRDNKSKTAGFHCRFHRARKDDKDFIGGDQTEVSDNKKQG